MKREKEMQSEGGREGEKERERIKGELPFVLYYSACFVNSTLVLTEG